MAKTNMIDLTVHSRNYRNVGTTYTEIFSPQDITGLRDIVNTDIVTGDALSGTSEFNYRGQHYSVNEAVADILAATTIVLTVESVDYDNLSATVETIFTYELMDDIREVRNEDLDDSGVDLSGETEFNYKGRHYSVSETLAEIMAMLESLIEHNNLLSIQGGSATQRYHMTLAEHTIATQAATDALAGYVSVAAQDFGGEKTFTDETFLADVDISGGITFDSQTLDSISTGAADNDKLVTQGYVDDAIAVEDLWDRTGTELSPKNANDDVVPNTTGNIGSATSYWGNAYVNHIFMTPTATGITVDGSGLSANHFLSFSAAGLGLTTGSLIDIGEITTKTGGYLHNGSMSTSVLTDSTLLDDFSVTCEHDGGAAGTLRMIRRTWSGGIPNGTANSNFAIFEGVFNGYVGDGGAEGGYVKGLHLDFTGATLQGSDIDAYPLFVDARGGIPSGGHGTSYNEFALARFVDSKNDTSFSVSDVAGESAIRTNGEINDRDYFSFFEDFCMQTINETDFGIVLHSNGGGSDPAIAANRARGEIDFVTGGTTDDGSGLQVAQPNPAFRATADEKGVFEAMVKVDDITDAKIFIGLKQGVASFEQPFDIDGSDAITGSIQGVGFVYDTTAATDNWFAVERTHGMLGTNTESFNTAVAPVNATYQKFRIEAKGALNRVYFKFYIDDVYYGELSTGYMDEDMYPTIVISELDGSARTGVADYIYSGHTR